LTGYYTSLGTLAGFKRSVNSLRNSSLRVIS
jgi:hypothetical protein